LPEAELFDTRIYAGAVIAYYRKAWQNVSSVLQWGYLVGILPTGVVCRDSWKELRTSLSGRFFSCNMLYHCGDQ
jgi:hypothetical protein